MPYNGNKSGDSKNNRTRLGLKQLRKIVAIMSNNFSKL